MFYFILELGPTDNSYPVKVSDVKSLTISYDVDLDAEGKYNLAPEIWLIGKKPASYPIETPENLITTEIMFWMDYNESNPAGEYTESLNFDGNEYDLFVKKEHNNSYNTVAWSIYSLVSKEKQLKGTINAMGLIKMLIRKGYDISEDEYIADVEFGTETLGNPGTTSFASGTLWINDLSVDLETK